MNPLGARAVVNADRMVAAGLASVLVPADATADSIAMAAKAVLAKSDRSAIDAARAEIEALPAPDDILSELASTFG